MKTFIIALSKHERMKHKFNTHKKKSPVAVVIAVIIIIAAALVVLMLTRPSGAPAAQTSSNEVLVTVNGVAVTQRDIDSLYERLPDEQKVPEAKILLLNQTSIPNTLLLLEAKKQGLSVSKESIDSQFADLLIQNGFDDAGFRQFLSQRNISYDDVKIDFADQLLIYQLVNKTVISAIVVTDAEVDEFYNTQQLASYNITLSDSTRQKLHSLMVNQQVNIGVQLLIKQLREKANIVYLKDPQ